MDISRLAKNECVADNVTYYCKFDNLFSDVVTICLETMVRKSEVIPK